MKHLPALILLASISNSATAAIITQSLTWDLSSVIAIDSSIIDSVSQSAKIDLFDPKLGSLTKVEFYRNAGVANAYLYASNIGDQTGQINISYDTTGYFSPNPSYSQVWFSVLNSGFFVAPNQSHSLISGGGLGSEGSALDAAFTGPALAMFTGVGVIDYLPKLDFSIRAYQLDPLVKASLEIGYSFDYKVTYFYDPTPVPIFPAMYLFGSGFLVLITMVRNKGTLICTN